MSGCVGTAGHPWSTWRPPEHGSFQAARLRLRGSVCKCSPLCSTPAPALVAVHPGWLGACGGLPRACSQAPAKCPANCPAPSFPARQEGTAAARACLSGVSHRPLTAQQRLESLARADCIAAPSSLETARGLGCSWELPPKTGRPTSNTQLPGGTVPICCVFLLSPETVRGTAGSQPASPVHPRESPGLPAGARGRPLPLGDQP